MLNILFDGRIFENAICDKKSRTGVFWVALNIIKNLLRKKDCSISLYLYDGLSIKYSELYSCLGILKIPVLSKQDDLSNFNSYISIYDKIPQEIKKYPMISSYTILHDIIPVLYPHYFNKNHFDNYNKFLAGLNSEDYYFSDSDNTKNDFLNFFPQINPDKIETISLATNLMYKINNDTQNLIKIQKKYNIPMDKKYLFSLCSLEPRKNLIKAVKAFITFINKNNIEDLVYVLGGSAWSGFIERLEKEVPEYEKYKDKIIRAGYIADEDLEILYSNAEWFVYTSQYEGFGMPPLEAMACGCPVITSNNSSLPEVVGNTGIMIDYDSDEQHVQAYEKYYFDKNFRNEMAQKGLERSKLFSWEKTVDIILNKMYEVEERKAQKPLVTIITPTYNLINEGRKDWFIQNLESVENQTYKNIEHIVIDGASTDGTLNILDEYQNKGLIKYFSEPDKGIYDALNKGILNAKGKYVVCLNSDDFYCDNNAVEWLVMKAEENEADACYGNAKRVKPDTLEFMNDWNGKKCFAPLTNSYPCHQTFLIKTNIMKELELYDTQYKVSADNIFFQKMVNYNKKFVGIDKDIITFRDGGFSNSNFELSKQERLKGYFEEYGQYHNLTPYDIQQFYNYNFLKLPIQEAIKLGSKLCYTNNPEWIEQYFTILLNHHLQNNVMSSQIEQPKNFVKKVKLFNFITIFKYKQDEKNKKWYFLGLPIFRIKYKNQNDTKYYLFSVPVLKVVRR